jgi:acetoin utilization protein AcuC
VRTRRPTPGRSASTATTRSSGSPGKRPSGGLTPGGDTPAVAELHTRAANVCGVSLAALMEVHEGRAHRALGVGGGLHHAFANRANGFCVYNDPAVAIHGLLDAGVGSVAFVDIDAHHSDGTGSIFYEDPRVLVCSIHEDGRYLFPGTGRVDERGAGEGEGATVNVPLPAFAGDEPYLRAIEEVVVPAVRSFGPEALVVEPGWDGHHADVLTHLQISMEGFRRAAATMVSLADDVTEGRFAAIGGGGYTGDVLARGTALFFAEMLGTELDDEIPAEWRELARELTGDEPSRLLRGDGDPEAPADARAEADGRAHRVIDEARALIR